MVFFAVKKSAPPVHRRFTPPPLAILLTLLTIIATVKAATSGPYLTVKSSMRGVICNKTLVSAQLKVESLAIRSSEQGGAEGNVGCQSPDGSARAYSPYKVIKQYDACSAPLYAALSNNEQLSVTFEYFDDFFYCTGVNASLSANTDRNGRIMSCNYTASQKFCLPSIYYNNSRTQSAVSRSTLLLEAYISSFTRLQTNDEEYEFVFKTLEQNFASMPISDTELPPSYTAYGCSNNVQQYTVYNISIPVDQMFLFRNINYMDYRTVEQVNYTLPQQGIISDQPYLVSYTQCPPRPPLPPFPPSPSAPPHPPPFPPPTPPSVKGSCDQCSQQPSTTSASGCSFVNGYPCSSGAGACSQCDSCDSSGYNGYSCTGCILFLCP